MSDHYFQILPAVAFSRTPYEDEIERYLADLRAMMFEAIALAPKMTWVGPVPVDFSGAKRPAGRAEGESKA